MEQNGKSVSIFNTEAKVLLEYDLSFLREILSLIRNGEDAFIAQTLRDYEHILIEAKRLDQNRLQREAQERIKGHEQMMEQRSDD